jgi:hypothetical protein
MGEIEEPLDDLNPMIESQLLDDHIFGPLIQQENSETENEKDPIFTFHLYPIEPHSARRIEHSVEILSVFSIFAMRSALCSLPFHPWIVSTHLWQMA